jgi:hypothetical protein
MYYLETALMTCRSVKTRYLDGDMLKIAHTNTEEHSWLAKEVQILIGLHTNNGWLTNCTYAPILPLFF